MLFSEGLAQYRDLLEPGKSLVITVAAEDRPEGINLRIQTVQSLEDEAGQVQKALRIYLRDAGAGRHAGDAAFDARGDGQVCFIVIKEDGRRGDRDRTAGSLPDLAADRLRDARSAGRGRSGTGIRARQPGDRLRVWVAGGGVRGGDRWWGLKAPTASR